MSRSAISSKRRCRSSRLSAFAVFSSDLLLHSFVCRCVGPLSPQSEVASLRLSHREEHLLWTHPHSRPRRADRRAIDPIDPSKRHSEQHRRRDHVPHLPQVADSQHLHALPRAQHRPGRSQLPRHAQLLLRFHQSHPAIPQRSPAELRGERGNRGKSAVDDPVRDREAAEHDAFLPRDLRLFGHSLRLHIGDGFARREARCAELSDASATERSWGRAAAIAESHFEAAAERNGRVVGDSDLVLLPLHDSVPFRIGHDGRIDAHRRERGAVHREIDRGSQSHERRRADHLRLRHMSRPRFESLDTIEAPSCWKWYASVVRFIASSLWERNGKSVSLW